MILGACLSLAARSDKAENNQRAAGMAAVLSRFVIGEEVQGAEPDKLAVPRLAGHVTGGRTVTLSWSACWDADGFEIFKSQDGVYVKYQIIQSPASGTFTEEGELDSTYSYKIRSYKKLSNGKKLCSSYSSVIVMKTSPSGKPTISAGKCTSVRNAVLKWVTIDTAEKYEIWRAAANGNFIKIDTVEAKDEDRQSYTDQRVTPGVTYQYKVRGVRRNYSGNVYSVYSNIRTVAPYERALESSGQRKVLFVGDSQMLYMESYLKWYWGGNSRVSFICKSGGDYPYLVSIASQIKSSVDRYTDVVFSFGVNDPDNVHLYASFYRNIVPALEKAGARVFILNVGPLEHDEWVTNEDIDHFNQILVSSLSGLRIADLNSYLKNRGYKTVDGLHYDNDTSRKIYDFALRTVGMI